MLGSNNSVPIGDASEELKRQLLEALTGSFSNATSRIIRNVMEGDVQSDKVVFPRTLPAYYVIWVNGISFAKGNFEEIDPLSIGLKNYIHTGDLVQLEFLELI